MLDTPHAAPTSKAEDTILQIWSDAFGISGLGIDDDFFDLNGDSLVAETITNQISEAFDIPLKPGALVEANTVREIAALLQGKSGPALPSHIVLLRSNGDRDPLFIVHGAAGQLFPTQAFLNGFHEDQPVYAFQVPGYDGQNEPMDTVEAIASEYLRCMKMVSPDGPWHLAAFCQGSWIAFEMAVQLRREGKRPLSLTLIDPGVINESRMHRDFMRTMGRKNGSGLSSLLSETRFRYKSLLNRIRCYRATGIWADPTDPDYYHIPEVWDYMQTRNSQRMARAMKKVETSGSDEERGERQAIRDDLDQMKALHEPEAFDNERELEIRRTPEANMAARKLKLAFYRYGPDTPIDLPVHLVTSEFRNRNLDNPLFPIRRWMPNLSILVQGQYHSDTVSTRGPENSSMMQQVIDTATSDRSAR